MSPDMVETARALAAHPSNPWRSRPTSGRSPHRARAGEDAGMLWRQVGGFGFVPDLADDATGGVLVGVLCGRLSCDVTIITGHRNDGKRWYRMRLGGTLEPDLCETLAHAAGLALVAVWATP